MEPKRTLIQENKLFSQLDKSASSLEVWRKLETLHGCCLIVMFFHIASCVTLPSCLYADYERISLSVYPFQPHRQSWAVWKWWCSNCLYLTVALRVKTQPRFTKCFKMSWGFFFSVLFCEIFGFMKCCVLRLSVWWGVFYEMCFRKWRIFWVFVFCEMLFLEMS